jgi:hypothetical protein
MQTLPQPRYAPGDLVRVAAPATAPGRALARVFPSRHRPVGRVLLVREVAWAPVPRRIIYRAQSSDGRRIWLYEDELEPGAPGPLVPAAEPVADVD